jgi:transposase
LSPGVLGLDSGCTTQQIEEGSMIFVGDDWAEDHHDVHVMDEAGLRLASRRLPEGLSGIGQLHALIAEHAEEPGQVVVGIETDRGLWLAALVAAGYQVFAVNPLAAARYRDRHHVSGAKSDASDAKLLADLVRTDRHNHRSVAGDSADAEAIKVLARAHQSLIWTRTRHTNALRNALREYYPAALRAFDDLAHGDALGVLDRAPSPEQAARLPLVAIQAALKRGGRQRNIADRAREIRAALRTDQLTAPAPVSAAFAATTRATVAIIAELNRRTVTWRPPWLSILRHTRTPTSTSPCQDLVLCSAPGCSVNSGTTRIATPTSSLAETTPAPHR